MQRRSFLQTAAGAWLAGDLLAQAPARVDNVIFVMTDGLRWQEVFRGIDPELVNRERGDVGNPGDLLRKFWRGTPEANREALMPFLWQTMAKQGQLWGNRDKGSVAEVTNGFNFSYPGYSETLTGYPDPRINSNAKTPNPNVTVLEWLNRRQGFEGKVAAFGAWDVISAIANGERGGFIAKAGYDLVKPSSPAMALLNRLKEETKMWGDEPFDAFAFHDALEYLKQQKPRVLYLSLGETDNWAHEGKYELYLKAAHRVDSYLKELWETAQAMPEYRGKTALIFTPDHGRGEAPVEWKSHGEKLPDSKYIWMAFQGPATPAKGERSNTAMVTQSQIAATLAAMLGEDYAAAVPKAGKPILDVLGR